MPLQTIAISNHPVTGNARKVDVDKIIINGGERRVTMACTVRQYKDGEEILPAYGVSLHATDHNMVDAQGNVVEEGIMTEYEFYLGLRSSAVKQEEIEEQAVYAADQSGRFNI